MPLPASRPWRKAALPKRKADFEKLAKLDPGIAEIHATLGAIYFKQGEYELAVKEVRDSAETQAQPAPARQPAGPFAGGTGSFLRSTAPAGEVLQAAGDAECQRMCGLQLLRAYTGLSRDADAVETALALNKLYPDDPEILYHTGRIYGNFAYIVMEKLHDKAPDSIWMLQAQGDANESQKNYDAAIAAFNHVLVLDPTRPGIHYRLGRIYLARFQDTQKPEDRDAAVREFTAELAVDPGNGNARYELANMQADLGNLEEASRQFESVLQRYPEFEEALVGLGGVDLQAHNPQAAVPLLERATRLRSDDEVAWYRLAQAERATGNKEAQLKALTAFKNLHSSTPGTLRKPNAGDEITPQKLDPTPSPDSTP